MDGSQGSCLTMIPPPRVALPPHLPASASLSPHHVPASSSLPTSLSLPHSPCPSSPPSPPHPPPVAASYFLAGATMTGGTITVEGCGSESLQGDVRFAEVMGLMGATVEWQPYSITITGGPAGWLGCACSLFSVCVFSCSAPLSPPAAAAPPPLLSLPRPRPRPVAPRRPPTPPATMRDARPRVQARPAASSKPLTTIATTSPMPP